MKANVILTPRQQKQVDFKLKQARQKRLVKSVTFNNNLSPDVKIAMIRNILI